LSTYSALELRIPPPAVGLLVGTLMWVTSSTLPSFAFTVPARTELAVAPALAGVVLGSLGFMSFRRARTTVNPIKPGETTALVAVGVYKLTRNPMYLGMLLMLIGWAIFLSNVVAFAFLPVFVLYINRFQIAPEERVLALKFGSEFAAYQASVRRWV
jgi:protein-S-isoprenylcysteine O-methyltransferase Ste14